MTDVDRFLDGLRRREEAYRRMARAAEEQAGALAAGDADALLAFAARQGALLGEIEAIERDLAPDRDRWPELRASLDPGTLREVEETVDRTRRVLEALVRGEDGGKALPGRPRGAAAAPAIQRRARGAYGAR